MKKQRIYLDPLDVEFKPFRTTLDEHQKIKERAKKEGVTYRTALRSIKKVIVYTAWLANNGTEKEVRKARRELKRSGIIILKLWDKNKRETHRKWRLENGG